MHEVVKTLTGNNHLPAAMRSLAKPSDVGWATSSDVRAFLAELGVIVLTEFDITVQGTRKTVRSLAHITMRATVKPE
jgi:hypothetical protein